MRRLEGGGGGGGGSLLLANNIVVLLLLVVVRPNAMESSNNNKSPAVMVSSDPISRTAAPVAREEVWEGPCFGLPKKGGNNPGGGSADETRGLGGIPAVRRDLWVGREVVEAGGKIMALGRLVVVSSLVLLHPVAVFSHEAKGGAYDRDADDGFSIIWLRL